MFHTGEKRDDDTHLFSYESIKLFVNRNFPTSYKEITVIQNVKILPTVLEYKRA